LSVRPMPERHLREIPSAVALTPEAPDENKEVPPLAEPVVADATTKPSEPIALSGSQRVLTALRAELEERKLQVAISEQLAKLEKTSAPASVPVVVPAPQLPPLPELPGTAALPGNRRPAHPVVVSVQGLSGKALSANIRLSSGRLMTAHQGDHVSGNNGGTVVSISRDGVKLRRGGTIETLPFE
ncbi:MAG: type IV pilus biogenesis protein PilP, partial [Bilophila sp.]